MVCMRWSWLLQSFHRRRARPPWCLLTRRSSLSPICQRHLNRHPPVTIVPYVFFVLSVYLSFSSSGRGRRRRIGLDHHPQLGPLAGVPRLPSQDRCYILSKSQAHRQKWTGSVGHFRCLTHCDVSLGIVFLFWVMHETRRHTIREGLNIWTHTHIYIYIIFHWGESIDIDASWLSTTHFGLGHN